MPNSDQIEFHIRNRLSHEEWLAQKATEILGEEETIRISYTPPSSKKIRDLFKLIVILMRSAFLYPKASVKALGYFFGLYKIKDISELYEPARPELEGLFELLNTGKLPDQEILSLPPIETYDDFLMLSHLFAKGVRDRLNEGSDVLTKVRWGMAHGIYNSLVHGESGAKIILRWKITHEEFQLHLVNAKNEERMKPYNVSINGIPISGVGGSLVTMRLLFDYFNLSEVVNAKGEEEIRLTLIHRRRTRRFSLRYQLALRIAQARDHIQLERILRQRP